MAVALTAGDIVLARIWTFAPTEVQAAVNSIHYTVSSVGGTPGNDQDVADLLDSIIAPEYKACLSHLAQYRGVQVYILKNTFPYLAKTVPAATIVNAGDGGGDSTYLPTQTAGIIRYGTPNPGPYGRGRSYIAFPSQSMDSGGGTPSNAYQADLLTLATSLAAGLAISTGGRTATLVRVIVHGTRKDGSHPGPSPVTTFLTSPAWGTQRKRGVFGRTNRSPI